MSLIKKEIFIASRFEEFKDIRNQLATKINCYKFMEAIDLNDNQASHGSPLAESLFHARKSEIMILLVGETYGSIPENESKSYTHLEYEEANKESSNTRILVICIGKSYEGKNIRYSSDPQMKKWQVELEKNHRLSKFGVDASLDDISEQIMIMLLSSLYELNPSEDLDLGQDEELYLDELKNDDENFLEDEEVAFLDNKKAETDGLTTLHVIDETAEGFELLKIPGKLAALEQKKEAQNAIELKDYYTAVKHLRKALELRPLDFESNYWLAKLYVVSAKKNLFYEIEEYLLRAAKIAEQEKNVFHASDCYQLIIQAAIFSDKKHEGLKYIQLAEELTPNYARLYYEKAKFMLFFDSFPEAKVALTQAINIRIDTLKKVAKDPFFTQYKTVINEIKKDFQGHLHKSCYAISSQTNEIKKILDLETTPVNLQGLSIYELWKKSRYGFYSQFRLISDSIANTNESQVSSVEKEIETLESNYKQDILSHVNQFTLTQDALQKQHQVKKNELESQNRAQESNTSSAMVIFLVLAIVGASIIILAKDIEKVFLLLPFASILLSIFFFTKTQATKKQYQEKRQSLLKEAEVELSELNQHQEEAKKSLLKEFEVQKYFSLQKIETIRTTYANIAKAFHYFETNTVSKSTSKLVPFKSLNAAYYGITIRVTPQAYAKSLVNGNTIEILEDFPDYLNIEPASPEDNAFIGKVIQKDKNKIVISRYQAYIR